MSYRLDPSERFTDQVRHTVEAQLQEAIHALEHQPGGLHEAIHEARKKCKRVRALYRLVAGDEKDFRREENERLKQAAASLSLVREATALIETVSYLGELSTSAEETEALDRTRIALVARRDAIAESETDLADKCKAAVESFRHAIEAVMAADFHDRPRRTAKAIRKAWVKNLRKANAARASCHAGSHTEYFHDLRKAGQNYWMHLMLLRDLWPSAMTAKRLEAKRLVDLLGREHDMSLLVELLDAEPGISGDGASLSHLLGAIIRRQQFVREEALALADTVFSDPPKKEAAAIAALWIEASTG